jgi:hypothetical protein
MCLLSLSLRPRQLTHLRQLRKQRVPNGGNQQRGTAANDHSGHRPQSGCSNARFKLTQFVRLASKHRAHPAVNSRPYLPRDNRVDIVSFVVIVLITGSACQQVSDRWLGRLDLGGC